jgi:hypothetical protein
MNLINFPTLTRAPSNIRMELESNTQEFGENGEQTFEMSGATWRLVLSFTNLSEADARKLQAFLVSQRGRAGRFKVFNFARRKPRGVGLVYPQAINYVPYSEDFSHATWGKSNVTVTTNQSISPDETMTADKLIANTANNLHYIDTGSQTSQLAQGVLAEVSIFVKKAELNRVLLNCVTYNGSGCGFEFRFSDERITNTGIGSGQAGQTITYEYAALGDGYYRLKMKNFSTTTGGTVPRIRIFMADDLGPGDTYGSKTNVNTTRAATTSPLAGWNADAVVENTTLGNHYWNLTYSMIAGETYKVTAKLKKLAVGVERWPSILFSGSSATGNVNQLIVIDLDTGATTLTSGTRVTWTVTAEADGWYLVEGEITALATSSAQIQFRLNDVSNNAATSYAGDGVSGFYLCGAYFYNTSNIKSYTGMAAPITQTATTFIGDNIKGVYAWGASYGAPGASAYTPTAQVGGTGSDRLSAWVMGANQTGNTLKVAGLYESVVTLFKQGDFFSVNGELKMITQDINSDALGRATLTFEPPLRSSPADISQVIFQDAPGTFRLSDDSIDWTSQYATTTDFNIACEEAF